jgi:Type IV secretory pathway, VirD4 components
MMCMAAGFQFMCAVWLMSVLTSGRFRSWKSWWPPSEAVKSLPVWCCRHRASSRQFTKIMPIPSSAIWILPSSWVAKSQQRWKSWRLFWERRP